MFQSPDIFLQFLTQCIYFSSDQGRSGSKSESIVSSSDGEFGSEFGEGGSEEIGGLQRGERGRDKEPKRKWKMDGRQNRKRKKEDGVSR